MLFAWVGVTLTYEGGTEGGSHENLWHFVVNGGLPMAMLKGITAFNLNEVAEVPRKTSGSWLTTFALGFSTIVLLTGYTAVVTGTLLLEAQTGASSVDEAIRKGYTFCAEASVHAQLITAFPKIASLLPVFPWGISELDRMDNGECTAAIVYQDQVQARLSLHTAIQVSIPRHHSIRMSNCPCATQPYVRATPHSPRIPCRAT